MDTKTLARFSAKVQIDAETNCWIWIAVKAEGYGQFKLDGKMVRAHRLSYEHFVGPIPTGLCVCHSCDNTSCVNPQHLFLGTHAQNMADRGAKGRQAHNKGEACGRSKLTEREVRAIRMFPTVPQRELALWFGVSQSTIWNIQTGKTWQGVLN